MTNSFAVSLHIFSLLFQITAVYFSYQLFRRVVVYRIPCLLLMLGFTIMVLRGLYPLIDAFHGVGLNEIDALTATSISGLLMAGMYYLVRAFSVIEIQSDLYEHDAKTDTMTGAIRKQEIIHRLEQEISRSFRNQQPLALIMFDIDHFKFVNDRYGHLVGDIVLKNLVQFSQGICRDIDLLGRVGGEEFLVILPNTNEHDAHEIAERIRIGVERHVVAKVNREPIRITISNGIAVMHPESELDMIHSILADKYLKQADYAMYQAKAAGRNQTVVYKAS
jgi:diguanylate cyclase (GGDEF)-like protein